MNSKPPAISSSLLSDLEGLSLSNISTAIQVHAFTCVCSSNTYDISSANVCWESIVCVWLKLTGVHGGLWVGEISFSPRGIFLPQMPCIDLYCLLIFITSQDSTTALPVSCISYSLSSSPWLSFALSHLWTLFLRLIWKSGLSLSHISLLLSVTFHRSLSDVVSLVSLCCVYLMVDLSSCDGSFLSSRCEQPCVSVFSISTAPTPTPPGKMSRSFLWLCLVCIFCDNTSVIIYNW